MRRPVCAPRFSIYVRRRKQRIAGDQHTLGLAFYFTVKYAHPDENNAQTTQVSFLEFGRKSLHGRSKPFCRRSKAVFDGILSIFRDTSGNGMSFINNYRKPKVAHAVMLRVFDYPRVKQEMPSVMFFYRGLLTLLFAQVDSI